MGLLDRIKQRLGKWTGTGGSGAYSSGYSYQNDTLASNETIFSAITMLSGAMASLPITLRKDYGRVAVQDHRISRHLEFGPNPNITTFQFIRSLEVARDSTGAGYAIKELDHRGRLLYLWQLRSESVTPVVEKESQELYYHIRDPDTREEFYLHNSLVLAVTHISEDGLHPINPIAVLRSSLEYDKEVKEFSVDQMRNGLKANLAVMLPGALNEKQIEEYNGMVRRFKRNGILYLDKGKKLQELREYSFIDPKVFEVEKITIARVARVYTIPLDKLLAEKSSYNSAEQSDLNYLRDTVLPLVRMYEQEFCRVLLTEEERAAGMTIKFSLNGFARADMQTRGEFYQKGIRNGWFCLDDVRALEDRPPLPQGQGQEFYISKDLIPVRLLDQFYKYLETKGDEDA